MTDLAARISLEHHERWDGNGYPRQKAGEEISLEARITSVADTYDVLCSKRPYKEAYPPEQAMEELIRCRGTQFDPGLVDAFLRNEKEVRSINPPFCRRPYDRAACKLAVATAVWSVVDRVCGEFLYSVALEPDRDYD